MVAFDPGVRLGIVYPGPDLIQRLGFLDELEFLVVDELRAFAADNLPPRGGGGIKDLGEDEGHCIFRDLQTRPGDVKRVFGCSLGSVKANPLISQSPSQEVSNRYSWCLGLHFSRRRRAGGGARPRYWCVNGWSEDDVRILRATPWTTKNWGS